MSVKKREKRYMTRQERRLRTMMTKHQVTVSDIAAHEDVTRQAIDNRLKSLTPSMEERIEDIILELSKIRSRKVAS